MLCDMQESLLPQHKFSYSLNKSIIYVFMLRLWPQHITSKQYIPLYRQLRHMVLTWCTGRLLLHVTVQCEEIHRHSTIHRHTCRWHLLAFIISMHPTVLFLAYLSRVRLPCRCIPVVMHSWNHSSQVMAMPVVKLIIWGVGILSQLCKYMFLLHNDTSACC